MTFIYLFIFNPKLCQNAIYAPEQWFWYSMDNDDSMPSVLFSFSFMDTETHKNVYLVGRKQGTVEKNWVMKYIIGLTTILNSYQYQGEAYRERSMRGKVSPQKRFSVSLDDKPYINMNEVSAKDFPFSSKISLAHGVNFVDKMEDSTGKGKNIKVNVSGANEDVGSTTHSLNTETSVDSLLFFNMQMSNGNSSHISSKSSYSFEARSRHSSASSNTEYESLGHGHKPFHYKLTDLKTINEVDNDIRIKDLTEWNHVSDGKYLKSVIIISIFKNRLHIL